MTAKALAGAGATLANGYSIVLVLVVWEGVARSHLVPAYFLPSLSGIAAQGAHDLLGGPLLAGTLTTLRRITVSFFAAILIGVPLGVAMARLSWVRWFFDPLISLAFPAPKIAFFPILMLWFGLGDLAMIVMTTLECVFPIVTASYLATLGVDRYLVWSARNLGTRGPALLMRVLVPAALPQITTGLQVALPIAFIVVILCEMLTGSAGLGGYVIEGYRFATTAKVFAGLFVIGFLGYGLMAAFAWWRRRFLAWHEEDA
ncbi:MAG: ABC transporter permease [Burkholderiales bacterium]|nr:ABC transporter permease [Burkholderiales bacterium]